MSISNLFIPNSYDLFCNSITPTVFTNIASGTYTPTAAALTNIGSITPNISYYIQVLNTVFVMALVSYNASLVSTNSAFSLSLPVARSTSGNFTSSTDACGSATQNDSSLVKLYSTGRVTAINGGQLIRIDISGITINPSTTTIIFSYQI